MTTTLNPENKTAYQLARETDKEIGQFIISTVEGADTAFVDTQIRNHKDVGFVRKMAIKAVDKQIKYFLKGIRSAPWLATRGSGTAAHIAFDSEWKFNEETGKNDILCYSYSVRVGDKTFSGVKDTDMAKLIKDCREKNLPNDEEMRLRKQLATKGYKLNFDKFIQELLIKAKARGFIDEWPEYTYLYSHFMRCDIASFEEFWKIGTNNKNQKNSLSAVQGSVTSGRGFYGMDLNSIGRHKYKLENTRFYTASNNAFETKVRFIDTLLLSSKASLDDIGELVGVKKEVIPEPYSIERMDELYCKDKALFNRYAIRDADIALKYGVRMQKFALSDMREDVGLELNCLPSTLGNFAVSLFRHTCGSTAEMHDFLGYETRKNQYYHAKSNSVRNSTEICKSPSREYTDTLAVNCFYGGCNFGAYFGPTTMGDYYDFDLSGAYTTALVDVLEADYANTRESKDIEDYLGHTMGFAYVRFKHPKGVTPVLPCRTSLRGIYYPMEGETYVTAPELQLAHDIGVEVKILHGQIIPWKKGSTSKFKEFTKIIRKQRAKYREEGNELYDQLWKLIGNTLYGKVGQGLRDKSGFDLASGLSSKIPYSPVTNAHYAAHATGFIRATMLEVITKLPDEARIISATTDGFLTNATQDQLDLSGPLAQRFQRTCDEVSGEDMMQLKHHAKQIISLKTRGQITAELGDTKPVCAKAGVKPPKSVDENQWMVELFLDRKPGQKVKRKHLASARDMWLKEMDLVTIYTEQRLNLEYDFKRRPVNPRMVKVRHPVTNEQVEHLSFDTVPWNTVDDGLTARTYFDEWRVNNCLKTMEDWDNWMDFYKVRLFLRGTHLKYKAEEGSAGIFKLQMLRAITQGKWGVPEQPKRAPRGHYDKLVAMFEDAGFDEITKKDLLNAKGRKLHEAVLPFTPRMLPMLSWFVRQYPTVDLHQVFHPNQVQEATQMLEEYNSNNTMKLAA